VVRNFGSLVVDMSAIVPDGKMTVTYNISTIILTGIVCFFTSYSYMEELVSMWNEMGVLNQVHLVFLSRVMMMMNQNALQLS
jgi:DNA excision repair protein ERCC-2